MSATMMKGVFVGLVICVVFPTAARAQTAHPCVSVVRLDSSKPTAPSADPPMDCQPGDRAIWVVVNDTDSVVKVKIYGFQKKSDAQAAQPLEMTEVHSDTIPKRKTDVVRVSKKDVHVRPTQDFGNSDLPYEPYQYSVEVTYLRNNKAAKTARLDPELDVTKPQGQQRNP